MIGKPEKMETEDRKTKKKTDLGKPKTIKLENRIRGKRPNWKKRKKTFKPQNVQMGKLNKNKKTRKPEKREPGNRKPEN